MPPTAIENFVEGITEPFPGTAEIRTFVSSVSGKVTGTVTVPAGAEAVIVRFRLVRATNYATTNYVVADDSTDVVNTQGETIREFEIDALTPGERYALVAQVVNATNVAISLPSPEVIVCVAGAVIERKAYLPPGVIEFTAFPLAQGKDLQMQVALIEEQWERMYPAVTYLNLKKATTESLTSGVSTPNKLSGEPGTTKYDPLYGEDVPESVAAGGVWAQPHGDAAQSVNASEKVYEPIELHARVQREAKERQLKRWGFDKIRDVILMVPASILDRFAITVEPGDIFVWDGQRYVVQQFARDGYWKNTNVRLYLIINAENYREGS